MFSKLLNFLKVLVPQQRHEMRLASFDKEKTLTVQSAESVFCRDGKTIALYQVGPSTITIRPVAKNPERVILYRASGRNGLCIFYYRDNPSRFHVACGHSICTIQRDDIPAVRKAIRKFTQNAKPELKKTPGKPFKEYEAPK